MNYNYVTLTIPYVWQFKEFPWVKVTRKGMVINTKTGNILKYTTRGFYIEGKYYKRKEIRNMVEKPKKQILNFQNINP